MCFSSYKNCELKVKLWWVEARERKRSAFFVTFISLEGIFFQYLGFISVYSVLKKLSEHIYFYIYQKHYFIHFCCLFSKSSKAFSASLTRLSGKKCVLLNSVKTQFCLASSDLFHLFTQSIKFYTFHYHVLNSTDVWKMWFIK